MDDYTAYKQKWFEFVDYTPHPGQLNIHNTPENVRIVVASCGRRWGKSLAAAREAEALVTQANKHQHTLPPSGYSALYMMI